MHAQVARALAGRNGPRFLPAASRTIALALHLDAADLSEEALPALVEAAAVATASHAYADAVALYRRAIARWHEQLADAREQSELVTLYAAAADVAHIADDSEAAIELVGHAIALHDAIADPLHAAVLHQRLCEFLWHNGMEAESI